MSVSKDLERLVSSKVLPGDTPAIVCSVPSARGASAASGVYDHLVKPISREALLGALDRLGLKGGTVLVVDDEPDVLQLFRRTLASSGHRYRVLLATDGRQALNILREYRPDLILLDLIMPNMDGFQLLEKRSQEPALRDVPIIVISARDPAGQPIVSSALAITRGGGLSVQQLLTSIKVMSGILSVTGQTGGLVPTRVPSAQPVYG
jgi:CheY-like chemotaxis protein